MTPQSLSITFSRCARDGSLAVDENSNRIVAFCTADSPDDDREAIVVSICQDPPAAVQDQHAGDSQMATLVNKARTKAVQIHHKGAKEGVKVKLEGVGTALKDVPTQGIKQNGYIITPSGANVGENISINGGGLVIRSFIHSSRAPAYSLSRT